MHPAPLARQGGRQLHSGSSLQGGSEPAGRQGTPQRAAPQLLLSGILHTLRKQPTHRRCPASPRRHAPTQRSVGGCPAPSHTHHAAVCAAARVPGTLHCAPFRSQHPGAAEAHLRHRSLGATRLRGPPAHGPALLAAIAVEVSEVGGRARCLRSQPPRRQPSPRRPAHPPPPQYRCRSVETAQRRQQKTRRHTG